MVACGEWIGELDGLGLLRLLRFGFGRRSRSLSSPALASWDSEYVILIVIRYFACKNFRLLVSGLVCTKAKDMNVPAFASGSSSSSLSLLHAFFQLLFFLSKPGGGLATFPCLGVACSVLAMVID